MIRRPPHPLHSSHMTTPTPRRHVPLSVLWRVGPKVLALLGGVLAGAVALGWLGLQVRPAAFPAYPQPQPELETIPLPEGLPTPVARFYRQLYGERIPVIESAVISGRGQMRIGGILFPARFRFTHVTGQAYRHYFDLTLFGLPIMQGNEWFQEGKSRLELPVGTIEGPQVDQGANLALWAEAVWMPAVWLTDPQVRWEPQDAQTARLVAPFGDEEERFLVRFDPETGLLRSLESQRYKAADSTDKLLWLNEVEAWQPLNGALIPVHSALTWADEATPWARFTTEEVVYNVAVDVSFEASGP